MGLSKTFRSRSTSRFKVALNDSAEGVRKFVCEALI